MRVVLHIALVGLGSGCGGVLRWGVGLLAGRLLGSGFPFGTFFINVTGCFFLGWFSTVLADRLIDSRLGPLGPDEFRLLVAVGFTGGYTTFSTFGLESDKLFRSGDTLAGTAYVLGSVLLGLVAVRLGGILASG